MDSQSPKLKLAADFINDELIETVKLVSPIIPVGGNGVLFGESTAGKTQLALTLAVAVAEGGFFLSKYRCRQGKVAILEVDSPPGEFKGRLEKIFRSKHSGDNVAVICHDEPIDVLELAAKKEPDEWIMDLIGFKPDLFIADTINKLHTGDEDDEHMPNKMFRALRKICGNSKAVIIGIHHPRKPGVDGESNHRYSARGSGAWVSDVEFVLHMAKGKGTQRFVSFPKAKGAADQPTLAVYLDPETLLVEISDRAKARAVELLAVGVSQAEALQLLVKEGNTESRAKAVLKELSTDLTESV